MTKTTVLVAACLLALGAGIALSTPAQACQINLGTCYADCPPSVLINVGQCGTPPPPPQNGP